MAVLLVGVGLCSRAAAQDGEVAGESRGGGYAWGEGGGDAGSATSADDPLRIMAFAGAGAGFRLVRNLDAPFQQQFLVPAYLDLGAALYLPGGDVRHGPAFYVSTNLMTDVQDRGTDAVTGRPITGDGIGAGEQWALTPGYALLLPLRRLAGMDQDLLQIQARIGVPIVLGTALASDGGGVDVSVGVELGLAIHYKFLAGLGVYFEAQAAMFGGSNDTVHPIITFDAGLMLDYEVLP